ncbi:hypothetical protein R80B4_01890 [Fibrobacteres bacterium R8-0-B4]
MEEDELIKAFLICVACAVFASVTWLMRKTFKRAEAKMDPNDFAVRRHNGLVVFLIVIIAILLSGIVFVAIPAMYKGDPDGIFVICFFTPMVLVCLFVIAVWRGRKIIVKGDRIRTTSFFGGERSFTFGDITEARLWFDHNGACVIHAYRGDKKLFTAESVCPGFNVLASRLKSEGVRVVGLNDKAA